MVWGPSLRHMGGKLSLLYSSSENLFTWDHSPWGPVPMEKLAFPHGWGVVSLAWEEDIYFLEALKTSMRLGEH